MTSRRPSRAAHRRRVRETLRQAILDRRSHVGGVYYNRSLHSIVDIPSTSTLCPRQDRGHGIDGYRTVTSAHLLALIRLCSARHGEWRSGAVVPGRNSPMSMGKAVTASGGT